MSEELTKKAANRLMELKEENQEMRDELQEAREKLAEYERRKQAEEVVLNARNCDEAPDRMKVASIDRFLALRAKLEEKDQEEFQKVATTVSMWNNEDDGVMPSEWSDPRESGDFNDWLESVTV